jgi:hypothetical protein
MVANPKPSGAQRTPSPLHDPLAGWTNDDLLLDVKEREHFAERFPRLAPIFDWEEMRDAFDLYEQPAKAARKGSRRQGMGAVALGFAGLALTALTLFFAKLSSAFFPKLFPTPDLAERWIGGAAAALVVLGMVVGFQQALIGQAKRRWLVSRYWTERIRQLHFQLILNNLEAAAAAIDDGEALKEWRIFRARALKNFLHDAEQNLEGAFDKLEDDYAEEDVWIEPAWTKPRPAPPQTPELVELLGGLRALRIGVQERYTALKLKPGAYSPQTRSVWLHGVSDVFTGAVLAITIVIGILYVHGSEEPRLWLLGLLGAAGALTAAVVALRVLNEGLLLRTEAERYRWYLASVRSIRDRFDRADAASERIGLLRELERLAYQEMRRFLITFGEARFIM